MTGHSNGLMNTRYGRYRQYMQRYKGIFDRILRFIAGKHLV